jgi:hypothetical protein
MARLPQPHDKSGSWPLLSKNCLNIPRHGDPCRRIRRSVGCDLARMLQDLQVLLIGATGFRTSDPLRPRRRNPHNWGQRETAAPRFP